MTDGNDRLFKQHKKFRLILKGKLLSKQELFDHTEMRSHNPQLHNYHHDIAINFLKLRQEEHK